MNFKETGSINVDTLDYPILCDRLEYFVWCVRERLESINARMIFFRSVVLTDTG